MDNEQKEFELNDTIDSEEGFVRLIAENMAIYANQPFNNEAFMPQARELLRSFKEIEGYLPDDYAELESWAGYIRWKGGQAR
jgi:hypothetical protein